MRILIIEDNSAIAANLYDYLESRGHSVEAALDGMKGYQLASEQHFDVILLDLGLPKMDGLMLCCKLREEGKVETPILMLTARDTLKDKLEGFKNGADDYLVKPFALEEVEARLGALHKRRHGKSAARLIQVDDLVYDSLNLSVTFLGTEVKLTPKCMRLLEIFVREPGRVFTRPQLENELWGDEQETSDRLRNHMHLLRRALIQSGGYDPIKTVHGMGFRLMSLTND